MPLPVYPDVNGNKHSWASVTLLIGTVKVKGCKSINYKNSMEPGMVRGTGVQVLGRTRGELSSEGSIELYLAEYNDLKKALSAGGVGFLERSFNITVSYSEPNSPIITDKLIGCRIKSPDKSFAQGTDALVVKCDLSVMYIVEDGDHPITDPIGV